MTIIRGQQMAALSQAALRSFQDRMVQHLAEHFPKHVEVLGRETVLEAVRRGCDRADAYGFTTEHEVCLFIDLTVMLGCGFDTDVQLPWAGEILKDGSIADPTARIDRLYDEAMAYLDRVVGKDQVFPADAFRTARGYRVEAVEKRVADGLLRGLRAMFRELWPAKCDAVGDGVLGRLIDQGVKSARACRIAAEGSVALYILYMFMMGHQFDRDPLYPWIPQILTDRATPDPAERVRRMHEQTLRRLAEALG